MERLGIRLFVLSLLAAVSTAAGAQNYTAVRDIRYAERRSGVAEGDTRNDRLLDVYLPAAEKPRKGYPTVMFIHGGGFAAGDKFDYGKVNPVIQGFVDRGYAVVAINYILGLKGSGHDCVERMKKGLPEEKTYHPVVQKAIDDAAEDASLALKWIGKNAGEYGFDTRKISICGGSAGACTCLALAYRTRPRRPSVKAVVNLWGAVADPGSALRRTPPMYTFHGDRDELIHIDNGKAIASRMEELGSGKSRFFLMQGKGHAQYKYIGEQKMNEIDDFLGSVGAK